MTRSSRRKLNCVHIDLTQIKHDSTCVTLQLPLDLACDNCKPKIEASIGMGKKSSMGQNRCVILIPIVRNAISCGRTNLERTAEPLLQYSSMSGLEII